MKLDHLVHATHDFCCPRFFGALFFARHSKFTNPDIPTFGCWQAVRLENSWAENKNRKNEPKKQQKRGNPQIYIYIWGVPKMMVPNNHWFSGFKNNHFGVFWGVPPFFMESSTKYKPKLCVMLILKKLSPKKPGKHQLFFEKSPAFQMLQIQLVHCTNIAEMKYGNLVVFTSRIQRVVKRLKMLFIVWWCLNLGENVTTKLTTIDSCWYVSICCAVWSTSRIQFPESVEMIRLAIPSTWMSQEVSKWLVNGL